MPTRGSRQRNRSAPATPKVPNVRPASPGTRARSRALNASLRRAGSRSRSIEVEWGLSDEVEKLGVKADQARVAQAKFMKRMEASAAAAAEKQDKLNDMMTRSITSLSESMVKMAQGQNGPKQLDPLEAKNAAAAAEKQEKLNDMMARSIASLGESVVKIAQGQNGPKQPDPFEVKNDAHDGIGKTTRGPPPGLPPVPVLAPRGPAPSGPEKRMIGGQARLASRVASMERSGDLEEEELKDFASALELGAKVSPRTRARFVRGTRTHAGSVVTDMLMSEGLLPPGGGQGGVMAAKEDFFDSMGQVMTERKAVRRKAAEKPFPTFNKLFLKFSDMGFFSRDFHASDPGEYWAMDWHFKCLTWMDRKHGWKVAGDYHARVMNRWNRFDRAAYADSIDARAGDWEQACQRDIYLAVLLDPDVKSSRARSSAGTLERVNDDDTYCEHHKRWFPREDNHNSHNCRMNQNSDKTKSKKEAKEAKKDKG